MGDVGSFIQAYLGGDDNIYLVDILAKCYGLKTWLPALLSVVIVVLRDRSPKEASLTLVTLALTILMAYCSVLYVFDSSGGMSAAMVSASVVFLIFVFRHGVTSLALMLVLMLSVVSNLCLSGCDTSMIFVSSAATAAVSVVLYILMCVAKPHLGLPTLKYYSSAYTQSGYSTDDIYVVLLSIACTVVYILF